MLNKMAKTLTEIAQELKDAKAKVQPNDDETKVVETKVQLIYAFNGTGKTRLSREFKALIAPKKNTQESVDEIEEMEHSHHQILYYNDFTEDLFYWDNDSQNTEPKLNIQPNAFTNWILKDQGQESNIVKYFQRYTNDKLTPKFNANITEVIFTIERGNDEKSGNLKISKGEESNFIWSVFYAMLDQVVDILNVVEIADRDTRDFDQLEYVFIDDPVSSLDENHLINLAVDLATLIKSSKSHLKFIITTHNPLFYNVLYNEFRKEKFKKYLLKKLEDGSYDLATQSNDSPFSYHLYLKAELEKVIQSGQISKYHFNFLRNILEKTSTFLGYKDWPELLPKAEGKINPYEARIINISSHSKHAGDEIAELTEDDKRVLTYLVKHLDKIYKPDLDNKK